MSEAHDARGSVTIPKARLDALTDGVFAVAMTLLVIDLRLPDRSVPKDGMGLLRLLGGLANQTLVYVISFYVLSLRWIGLVRTAPRGEHVGGAYTRWALINLLLTTFVPFATMVVGRYPSFAAAVWLYTATIILLAATSLRMIAHETIEPELARNARLGLGLLIVSALVAIAFSLVAPKYALFGYIVNLVDQPFRRMRRKRGAQ